MLKVESFDAKTVDASKIFPFNEESVLSATHWSVAPKYWYKSRFDD
jgi:hypothetical protein